MRYVWPNQQQKLCSQFIFFTDLNRLHLQWTLLKTNMSEWETHVHSPQREKCEIRHLFCLNQTNYSVTVRIFFFFFKNTNSSILFCVLLTIFPLALHITSRRWGCWKLEPVDFFVCCLFFHVSVSPKAFPCPPQIPEHDSYSVSWPRGQSLPQQRPLWRQPQTTEENWERRRLRVPGVSACVL